MLLNCFAHKDVLRPDPSLLYDSRATDPNSSKFRKKDTEPAVHITTLATQVVNGICQAKEQPGCLVELGKLWNGTSLGQLECVHFSTEAAAY